MNYPELLWESAKAGLFPNLSGDDEKRLKLAFIQGMHSGRECVVQGLNLSNEECVTFNRELKEQIAGSLSQLGHRPGRVNIGTRPKAPDIRVRTKINGEELS